MPAGSRKFVPPRPTGEPFRADPRSPAPFPTDRDVGGVTRPPVHQPSLAAPVATDAFRGVQQPVFERDTRRYGGEDERYAWRALAVGILSVFAFGIVLGPIAIVMGAKAIRRGQTQAGAWAIATGITGIVMTILMVVLYVTGALDSLERALDGGSR